MDSCSIVKSGLHTLLPPKVDMSLMGVVKLRQGDRLHLLEGLGGGGSCFKFFNRSLVFSEGSLGVVSHLDRLSPGLFCDDGEDLIEEGDQPALHVVVSVDLVEQGEGVGADFIQVLSSQSISTLSFNLSTSTPSF